MKRKNKKLLMCRAVIRLLCVIAVVAGVITGLCCGAGKIISVFKNSDKSNAAYEKAKAGIADNTEKYPEDLIEAFEKNPELANYVAGYLDKLGTSNDGLTSKEIKEQFPLLLQWDDRWGYATYGDNVIGLNGCGPTCLSMVIISFTGDDSATPLKVAQYSAENGFYVDGVGTSWDLMSAGAEGYGLNSEQISLSEEVMKNHLDNGEMIICSMGPGDFTSAGHFIVICGYDEDGFIVNDPNSVSRSKKHWKYDTIESQIRNLWSYSSNM